MGCKMDYEFINSFNEPELNGNWIKDINPINKINMMVVLGIAPLIVNQYKFGFGMVIFVFFLAMLAGCFREFVSVYWKIFVLFGIFLFLVKAAFSSGETVLFQIWNICITKESIITGLNSISVVLAFSGAVVLFSKITPVYQLTYALEQKGLSHESSFIILSSFQTIIDLGNSAKTIMDSQKARGIETEGNLLQRGKSYIPVMGPLVLNAISSTEEKSIAMDARAFSAPNKHTFLRELPVISNKEKLFIIILDLFLGGVIIWRIASWII